MTELGTTAPAVPWPGEPHPLGATWDGVGTNVALWSEHAEWVELAVLDDDDTELCIPLTERSLNVWHAYVPDLRPGTRYGFRVSGPWAPDQGHRFTPDALLLDPYALAVDSLADGRLVSVVVDPGYDWGDDRAPQTSWTDTVIYEAHLRGLTRLHPEVPPELRGTYAGLAHPAVVDYLVSLGITAVELLPVHQFRSEPFLEARGLTNYWGYNTAAFFAPHHAYASGGSRGEQVREFKDMVKTLHAAGLEVILDVVYNHTAEAGPDGPVLSFRGIDNAIYYHRHGAANADYTGCGNSVNASHPQVLQLVLDSLRYWVQEMHVDGFRFDLATTLARREGGDVDMNGPFLIAARQDPVLRNVKLIAEPWDVGWGGYRVGEFPSPWAEWNDKFRNGVRDFWRGATAGVREIAYRVSGSSDIYGTRRPHASVNFVTAHDGFTLRDLVSYDRKHNAANGEDGRDGTDDNRSWNCGAEGETADASILALRARQQRNMLVTLLLATGVPMLTAGDEFGRTQHGNNNAYCQDNAISWMPWDLDEPQEALLAFTRRVLDLRRSNVALRQKHFFEGRPLEPGGPKDIAWFTSEGREMEEGTWFDPSTRTLGVRLSGLTVRRRGPRGERLVGSTFLVLLHSGPEDRTITLPPTGTLGGRWELVIDTADDDALPVEYAPGARVEITGRSTLVLRAG
ncbi:glycogen operon protein [Motilibacter peucedani]|uniref:Glycogen operon protein n=1 Tax=Motilibacter peucedani TaxID=598650 RepID=A0A420XLL7_9ACTN|nr:glycogen debranching protein GlgX [Motilibacter peucedani]RKS71313.1 glycogen operon protein [Motilibacter peucedani]